MLGEDDMAGAMGSLVVARWGQPTPPSGPRPPPRPLAFYVHVFSPFCINFAIIPA